MSGRRGRRHHSGCCPEQNLVPQPADAASAKKKKFAEYHITISILTMRNIPEFGYERRDACFQSRIADGTLVEPQPDFWTLSLYPARII